MITRDCSTLRTPTHRPLLALLFIVALSVATGQNAHAQGTWVESNIGLERAHAAALVFDSTGRALVATACGLYRLDADRWSAILDRDSVSAVVVSPAGTILAGTTSGLWRRSSVGSSWTTVHDGVNTSALVSLGGDTLLAIIGAKLHHSTDDGVTWTPDDNLPQSAAGRLAITRDGLIYAWRYGNLYRSSDRGVTWASITQTLFLTLVVPISGDRLLGVWADSLYESSDAGREWRSVRQLPANDLRLGRNGGFLAAVGLPRMLAVTPATAPGAYTLNDDGSIAAFLRPGLAHAIAEGPDGDLVVGSNPDLFVSSDGAASWDLVDAGLECAMLSNITIDRAGRMYGVLKGIRWTTEPYSLGTIHRSLDSGRTWQRLTDGVAAILGAFASGEVIVGARDSTGMLIARASRDHGLTWIDLATPPVVPYVSGNDSGVVALSFRWDNSFPADIASQLWLSTDTARTWTIRATGSRATAVLATGGALLLVGAVGTTGFDVYRSSDDGTTWTSVVESPATNSLQVAPDGDIFVVSLRGGLFVQRSTDDGLTWDLRDELPGNYFGPLIFASNGDLYATGPRVPTPLLRSTNDGSDWSLVEVPWPGTTSVSVLADGRLVGIASNAQGVHVWESRDGGTTWRTEVHPALASPSLRLAPWGELFAGVGPQRLLRVDGPISSAPLERRHVPGVAVNAAPVPARGTVRLNISMVAPTDVLVSLHSVDGTRRIQPSRHRLAAGDNSIVVDLADLAPGIYVAIVATSDAIVSERIVVR